MKGFTSIVSFPSVVVGNLSFPFFSNNRSPTETFGDDGNKCQILLNPFIFFSLLRPLYLGKTAFYTHFYIVDTSGYIQPLLSKF